MSLVYLITGVSRGLGLGWADDLTRTAPDDIVIGVARSPEKAPKLQQLMSARKNLHIIKGDISSNESVEHIIAETRRIGGGRVDYLINNAGVVDSPHSIFDSPLEDYVSMFDINVLGTIRLTLAALPLLRAGSKKVIFNVSSILGSNSLLLEQGVVFAHAPFSVSKAALNMFNTKLAKEIAAEGLITVTIRPGFVDTDKNEGPSGAISVAESVAGQKTVLHSLTLADNGKYYGHEGDTVPF